MIKKEKSSRKLRDLTFFDASQIVRDGAELKNYERIFGPKIASQMGSSLENILNDINHRWFDESASLLCKEFQKKLKTKKLTLKFSYTVQLSVGTAHYNTSPTQTFDCVLKCTDDIKVLECAARQLAYKWYLRLEELQEPPYPNEFYSFKLNLCGSISSSIESM